MRGQASARRSPFVSSMRFVGGTRHARARAAAADLDSPWSRPLPRRTVAARFASPPGGAAPHSCFPGQSRPRPDRPGLYPKIGGDIPFARLTKNPTKAVGRAFYCVSSPCSQHSFDDIICASLHISYSVFTRLYSPDFLTNTWLSDCSEGSGVCVKQRHISLIRR